MTTNKRRHVVLTEDQLEVLEEALQGLAGDYVTPELEPVSAFARKKLKVIAAIRRAVDRSRERSKPHVANRR